MSQASSKHPRRDVRGLGIKDVVRLRIFDPKKGTLSASGDDEFFLADTLEQAIRSFAGKHDPANVRAYWATGLEPVVEDSSGMIIAWSTERPHHPPELLLHELRLVQVLYLRTRQPMETHMVPLGSFRATGRSLGLAREAIDLILGGDGFSPFARARDGQLRFVYTELSDDDDGVEFMSAWYSERVELGRRISTALTGMDISDSAQERFGRCRVCTKLTHKAGEKLRRRKGWQAEHEDLVCQGHQK